MMAGISDHKDRTRLDHATSTIDCELKSQDGNKSPWANLSVSATHKALGGGGDSVNKGGRGDMSGFLFLGITMTRPGFFKN